MRAPKRKREPSRQMGVPVGVDVAALAGRATYVGSAEHKDAPSFAGHPRPRADASICPRDLTQAQVEGWLRDAIRIGAVSANFEDSFPRYAWHKHEGIVYEARLINRELGQYKGYPLNDDEWPPDLGAYYE